MFKSWFRNIIAEELQKVTTSLADERSKITSVISTHTKAALNALEGEIARLVDDGNVRKAIEAFKSSQVDAFEARIKQLLEDEHTAFKAKLNQTFENATKDDPTHWKAEDDVVAADHRLRKVK